VFDPGFDGASSTHEWKEALWARLYMGAPGLLGAFGLAGNRAVLSNNLRTRKFSQELRLASSGEATIDWLVGGFYTKEKTRRLQTLDAIDRTSGALVQRLLTAGFPSNLVEVAGFADQIRCHVRADQNFDLRNDLNASLGGTLSYLGRRLGTAAPAANTPRGVAPASRRSTCAAALNIGGIRYNLYVRNVTDRRGYTSAELRAAGNLASGYNLGVIQPRTFGGSLAVAF
jgi:hypothetical protein